MSNQAGDTGSEAWFLAQLEKAAPETAQVIAALEAQRAAGQADMAESRAEMMQDALVEKGKLDDALALLELRISWVTGRTGLAERADAIGGGRRAKVQVAEEAGA